MAVDHRKENSRAERSFSLLSCLSLGGGLLLFFARIATKCPVYFSRRVHLKGSACLEVGQIFAFPAPLRKRPTNAKKDRLFLVAVWHPKPVMDAASCGFPGHTPPLSHVQSLDFLSQQGFISVFEA